MPVFGQPEQGRLARRIAAAITAVGKKPETLTVEDLAALDQYHLGGLEATRELAGMAGLAPGERVLELGCGLGGAARVLAIEYGCEVAGVDRDAEVIAAARALTGWMGLTGSVAFAECEIEQIEGPADAFDAAWAQASLMGIADKAALFRRVRELLKPGGRLAFQDLCRVEGREPLYPVSWAAGPGEEWLLTAGEERALVARCGFIERHWEDMTPPVGEAPDERFERVRLPAPPIVGLHLLVGAAGVASAGNVLLNFVQGRVRSVRGVFEAAG